MFKKILVALDGSEFAERAIEPAFAIAKQFGGEVILLRVITVEEDTPISAGVGLKRHKLQPVYTERYFQEAENYLRGIQVHWIGTGMNVRVQAVIGEPAETIAAAASGECVDLIVMSTHGRSGLTRLLYGSVAEAVLRGVNIPLLLIPIKESRENK